MNGYDVAILVMKEDFRINKNVQVAKLPSIGEYCPFGESLIVSGWGDERHPDTSMPDVVLADHDYLWAVKQRCVGTENCAAIRGDKGAIICAEGPADARDSACVGDSGGNIIPEHIIQK